MLALLATGTQVLQHLSPPLGEAWCRMMLDSRGESVLPNQVLIDVLLRATGRTG